MAQKEKETHEGTIALNRRARYDYFIDERYEAGLVGAMFSLLGVLVILLER